MNAMNLSSRRTVMNNALYQVGPALTLLAASPMMMGCPPTGPSCDDGNAVYVRPSSCLPQTTDGENGSSTSWETTQTTGETTNVMFVSDSESDTTSAFGTGTTSTATATTTSPSCDPPCGTGEVCNLESETCVECVEDDDCAMTGVLYCNDNNACECEDSGDCQEGLLCDSNSGACVECLGPDNDDACGEKKYCNDEYECVTANSCGQLVEWGYTGNELRWLNPVKCTPDEHDDDVAQFRCDNEWTCVSFKLAYEELCGDESRLVSREAPVANATLGTQTWSGPYTQHTPSEGFHTYNYTFDTHPFNSFKLVDYTIRAAPSPNNQCDVESAIFTADSWGKGHNTPQVGDGRGDIFLGVPGGGDDPQGIVTTLAVEVGDESKTFSDSEEYYFSNKSFQLAEEFAESKQFRIGWGEFGDDYEGWEPWYSGEICLR